MTLLTRKRPGTVFIFAACLLVSGLPALVLIKVTCLTIRLADQDDNIYYLEKLKPGEDFSLNYRHSVEKTRVKGIFEVTKTGRMAAKQTWMTSVGTGLPNTFHARTRRQGEWIVVDEGHKILEPFRFFIEPVNQSFISTPRKKVDLMKLDPGTVILVGIEPVSLMTFLLQQAQRP